MNKLVKVVISPSPYDCEICKGRELIEKALAIIEDMPELNIDFFDSDVVNVYNALLDAESTWDCVCRYSVEEQAELFGLDARNKQNHSLSIGGNMSIQSIIDQARALAQREQIDHDEEYNHRVDTICEAVIEALSVAYPELILPETYAVTEMYAGMPTGLQWKINDDKLRLLELKVYGYFRDGEASAIIPEPRNINNANQRFETAYSTWWQSVTK